MRLSEKYIAGLFDADGSVGLIERPLDRGDTQPDKRRVYVTMEITQMSCEVIDMAASTLGFGEPTTGIRGERRLRLSGKKAMSALNRLRPYLVAKRAAVIALIGRNGDTVGTGEHLAIMKAARALQSHPSPNYPSRKWMAGYVDGNGCVMARDLGEGNSTQAILECVDEAIDREAIDLMAKAFGGSIQEFTSENGTPCVKWCLSMPASKVKEIFHHCGKHMIVKKPQMYFLRGCADLGHFRDGDNIVPIMRELNSQPHRLSEMDAGLVTGLLRRVRDVPPRKRQSTREAV